MYYLQSRYYDANVGRFVNADDPVFSVFFACNLFAYCDNNPPINSDPYGYGTVTITLKKDFLRDVVTASTSALGTIIGAAIFGFSGAGAVIAGAIGAALGWIIGGSLSRKFINKELKFKVWIPFVKTKSYTVW